MIKSKQVISKKIKKNQWLMDKYIKESNKNKKIYINFLNHILI